MDKDQDYESIIFKFSEVSHDYGDKLHGLTASHSQLALAKIGYPEIHMSELNHFVESKARTTVVVGLAHTLTWPSGNYFQFLQDIASEDHLRQNHFYIDYKAQFDCTSCYCAPKEFELMA